MKPRADDLDWYTPLTRAAILWSGALATAGDVVFYGTMDGWFKALDAHKRNHRVAV